MIPCTPRSRNRRIVESSWLGMRVIGVMPNTSAARTMCSTSSRLIGPCSQSIMTKSYPIAPKSSTRSGAWRLMIAPNTTLPSASFAFVVFVRMACRSPSGLHGNDDLRARADVRSELVPATHREELRGGDGGRAVQLVDRRVDPARPPFRLTGRPLRYLTGGDIAPTSPHSRTFQRVRKMDRVVPPIPSGLDYGVDLRGHDQQALWEFAHGWCLPCSCLRSPATPFGMNRIESTRSAPNTGWTRSRETMPAISGQNWRN